MTATRPQRLPEGAGEQAIVRAAAALEQVSPAVALRSWEAVLLRWPDNRFAALGLGNAAWANGDHAPARQAWQQVVQRHPDLADAWNNLANALDAHGDRGAARSAAQRAIALGGPHVETYRETLQRAELR
jgi:tetratricopeptide (TPR) repeat protein